MNCAHCGTILPEQANFCLQCGAVQQTKVVDKLVCNVVFRQVDEKWSLFGKEICRFEAVGEDGATIAVSDKFTLTGFEIYGPNEKNRKYKAAFDGLVKKLLAEGWKQTEKAGKQWFELQFQQS
ncbi:hypothetical protein AXX12_14780 [Anaerosporomusa subterranea]|uniref:Zinc-ribbon domain-containing protein n=1 Tax=Anaerosporomusa subterranea TaxID=1794912 RepID=A0A154BPI2_ANASB|nr:zinc ribbon domain-containing protein [Anaerosporomusa subterranea]KYZ75408.1 hypothetical protein AXX12_14780 [Anaerosporomusa subterranea]